ncbi:hypothetical protein GGR08_001159, partial [Bartonella fuyuanensis]|nr:hypothetical protein [Bartonella fuyuanensis]
DLDKNGETPLVTFKVSLSTLGFSTAYRSIFINTPQYTVLKELEEVYAVSSTELDEGKLKQICTDILEWADNQNTNQIIYDYAALPTNSELDLIIRHFIALILIGDVEKLKFYKESLKDKNFSALIKENIAHIIDNVLTLARRYRTGFRVVSFLILIIFAGFFIF